MRFASIGAINTLLDAALFAALHTNGLSIGLANFVSSSAGMIVSLLLNSRYTFRAGRLTLRQVVLFITINLVGLWVLRPVTIAMLLFLFKQSLVEIWPSIDGYTINFMASIAATGSTFLWNYLLYSRFVYRQSPNIANTQTKEQELS